MSHAKKTHTRKKVMIRPKHADTRLTRNRKPPVRNEMGKWVRAYKEQSGDDRFEMTQAEERLMDQEEDWDPRD